jgi:hypothetical protein
VPGAREHPCREAYQALEQAGFEPDVVKTHSYGALPMALQTPSRKHVNEKTGSPWVPALETDEGEWISGTREIVDWASSRAG